MSGFSAQNTCKRPASDDKSASLPKSQGLFVLGGQSRKIWNNFVFWSLTRLQRRGMSGFWTQNTRKRPGPDDKSALLPKIQWLFFLRGQSRKIWNNLVFWSLTRHQRRVMSSFWAQNTRKKPSSDDKSASLPKSQWLFYLGGRSRKIWNNLVFWSLTRLQRRVMSGFWAQNTRKRPASDDKSASLPKSQWLLENI
jgi:hypothetical protein